MKLTLKKKNFLPTNTSIKQLPSQHQWCFTPPLTIVPITSIILCQRRNTTTEKMTKKTTEAHRGSSSSLLPSSPLLLLLFYHIPCLSHSQLHTHKLSHSTLCTLSFLFVFITSQLVERMIPIKQQKHQYHYSHNNNRSLEESITMLDRNPNVFAASKLISEVCKQKNDLDLAFRIYQTLISSRMKPNLAVFGALINGCRILGQPIRALSLIDEMERYSIEPDKKCFGLLTMTCSQTGDVAMANKLINKMTSGQMKFEVNVIDCTQLIQAITKNSNERRADLETAMEIVKFMDQRNIELDNTARSGFIREEISV